MNEVNGAGLVNRWGQTTSVAQIANLLYRRLGVGWWRNGPRCVAFSQAGRLPTCDTADCQSALPIHHPFGVGHPADHPLTLRHTLALTALTIVSFHLAYVLPRGGFLMAGHLLGLFSLSQLRTSRQAFYLGFGIGFAVYAPHLAFFWTIFGAPAMVLWSVLAFWLGLFLVLSRAVRCHLGAMGAAVLIPFLWTGLEYFRSELYYLRFSWLNVGYAFSDSPLLSLLMRPGVYGLGFLLMLFVGLTSLLSFKARIVSGVVFLCTFGLAVNLPIHLTPPPATRSVSVPVAGMQMEFPAALEVPQKLDQLLKQQPSAQLLVLSEYSFDGPIPRRVRDWCRRHQRYLVAGGKDPAEGAQFFNTAFITGPQGETVFQQAKRTPIQFFKDGLPAPTQKLWASPWGQIGLCVCYDLSYRRVTDALVGLGAEALIVPTMDIAEWGRYQHQLHGRVAKVRAAEFGLPVFRVCSSGVSQLTDRQGQVTASAPFPGEDAVLAGSLELAGPGRLPWDHWGAPLAVGVTIAISVYLAACEILQFLLNRRKHPGARMPSSARS
jgi:apolipoprotein N-acyltransferase